MRHLIIVTGHLTTKPRQQQCVDLIKKIKKSYPDIDILYATHDKNIPKEIIEDSSSFVYTKNIIMNWDYYTEDTKREHFGILLDRGPVIHYVPSHAYSHYRSICEALKLGQIQGYDYFHHFTYDCNDESIKLLKNHITDAEKYDFIGYQYNNDPRLLTPKSSSVNSEFFSLNQNFSKIYTKFSDKDVYLKLFWGKGLEWVTGEICDANIKNFKLNIVKPNHNSKITTFGNQSVGFMHTEKISNNNDIRTFIEEENDYFNILIPFKSGKKYFITNYFAKIGDVNILQDQKKKINLYYKQKNEDLQGFIKMKINDKMVKLQKDGAGWTTEIQPPCNVKLYIGDKLQYHWYLHDDKQFGIHIKK